MKKTDMIVICELIFNNINFKFVKQHNKNRNELMKYSLNILCKIGDINAEWRMLFKLIKTS